MKKNMKYLQSKDKGITLVAMVITIIVLLLLAGIAIATLGGENGLFTRVKQAKKAHIQSEMKEQLTMGLQELQVEKQGNATLDDVTQDWANKIISTEYNANSVEVEYTTVSRTDNKVRINIVVTDNINGIKQIDYPEGNPLKVVSGVEKKISIDYDVELGVEYRFVVTSGDGSKTEKIIKIDDYFYNVTKTLGDGATIDNNTTKAAYNKTYEATITTTGNYAVTDLTVTMGGKTVTTAGNNVVNINTGKIKIEKVTGDINITATTKKLEIQYKIGVNASGSSNDTSTLKANTQPKGTPLYINIIATLEGNKCTAVLKSDNTETVPYAVTSNGKYTFIVTGTYNGKTIEEEKEVIVNQYMSAQGVVQYDAGDWTEEEINELKSKKLYNINKKKIANTTTGLNFTFGGFTYKGDTENASDIASGNIITSRNQSVTPQGGWGTPKYSGWQILESKEENGKTYVTKITHAGSPENFVYYYTKSDDNKRVEYILSGGQRQTDYGTYQARDWNMYKDKTLEKNGYISDVHAMTYDEAYKITGNTSSTTGMRNTEAYYLLASAFTSNNVSIWRVGSDGEIYRSGAFCLGVRPVVSLTSGVYIKSGIGTEADPYILGKDE